MSDARLRVNIYVDGFNLFFGALRATPFRWLDLNALARHLLEPLFPDFEIGTIRYCTAPAKGSGSLRQQVYWRALSTQSNVVIHRGVHKARVKNPRFADGSGFARVLQQEEKATDVNLASYLIQDAVDDCYDVALLISNDSDLVTAVDLVQRRFGVSVVLSAPIYFEHRSRPMKPLVDVASLSAHITKERKQCLRESQFPAQPGVKGRTITRPREWD